MSEVLRRELPLGLAMFIIAFTLFDYYVKIDAVRAVSLTIQDWAVICTAFAAGVGIINMLTRTFRNIRKKEPYWYFDMWMIVVFVILVIFGMIGVYGSHPVFTWIMSYMYLPIDGSIYAMVFFDIIAAFYRTFRARTTDAAILLVCAFIVMVANAPITGGLFPQWFAISNWVNDIPNATASRAINVVAAIGIVGFAVRTMLGHERATVGVVD